MRPDGPDDGPRLREVPEPLRTPVGRTRLGLAAIRRAWPLLGLAAIRRAWPLLAPRDVRVRLVGVDVKIRCEQCPMLERGW